MPAIAMPGKENGRSFWLVPTLELGADQCTDARASRTAFPRWSVGTIDSVLVSFMRVEGVNEGGNEGVSEGVNLFYQRLKKGMGTQCSWTLMLLLKGYQSPDDRIAEWMRRVARRSTAALRGNRRRSRLPPAASL